MERVERFAPLTGVVAVVLWVVGIVVMDSDLPADTATGTEIAAWFDQKSGTILLAMTFFGVGSAAFVWFLGTVAARLRSANGDARLPGIMFVAGTATIVLVTMGPGSYTAGALGSENLKRALEPGAAEALFVLGQGFFVAGELIAVAYMGAAGLAILRSRLLPPWFGWVSIALAAILVVNPIGWAALYLGVPLWTLVAGVWLYVRGPAEAPEHAMSLA
ncbi:MAG: hypothetical protein M3R37_13010 [Actinomycetota bacterium]|nr:hypothetical protein [Actinomycetota bacterium]